MGTTKRITVEHLGPEATADDLIAYHEMALSRGLDSWMRPPACEVVGTEEQLAALWEAYCGSAAEQEHDGKE